MDIVPDVIHLIDSQAKVGLKVVDENEALLDRYALCLMLHLFYFLEVCWRHLDAFATCQVCQKLAREHDKTKIVWVHAKKMDHLKFMRQIRGKWKLMKNYMRP